MRKTRLTGTHNDKDKSGREHNQSFHSFVSLSVCALTVIAVTGGCKLAGTEKHKAVSYTHLDVYKRQHSIECLYKLACDKKNIDRRISVYFENIEDMIYFYYFDEEGDAFKYELNKEDEPHMIKNKISHVSIELLETEFKDCLLYTS